MKDRLSLNYNIQTHTISDTEKYIKRLEVAVDLLAMADSEETRDSIIAQLRKDLEASLTKYEMKK